MYYPDLFEGTNNKTLPPPPPPGIPDMTLFQSQETVATIGSMNTEFVDLMMMDQAKTIHSTTDCTGNTSDEEAHVSGSVEILSPPPPLDTESTPLLAMAGPTESICDVDYLSDDSSLWVPPHHHHHIQQQQQQQQYHHHINKDNNNKNEKKKEKIGNIQRESSDQKAGRSVRRTRCRRVRRSYDIAESDRTYVRYTDADVLCQRGGLANKHPGNHRYLDAKAALQESYREAIKSKRTVVAQQLVDAVRGWGGRFLRYDAKARSWYEIHNHAARTKAGQALREEYTPEDRKRKRKRYRSNRNHREHRPQRGHPDGNDDDDDDDEDSSWVEEV